MNDGIRKKMIAECNRSRYGSGIDYPDTRPRPGGARRLRASPTREPVRSFNVEFVNHEELYIISNAPGFNSIWITSATGIL